MSTNLAYRAGERQRKRESTRKASKAQREKGQQRSTARGKKKTKDIFFGAGGGEQHENFVVAV